MVCMRVRGIYATPEKIALRADLRLQFVIVGADFGEWLRQQRRAVGYRRQEDLAADLSVTQPTVSAWETGETVPERERIPALAEILGVPVDEVLARAYDASFADLSELRRMIRRHELRFDVITTILERLIARTDEMCEQLDVQDGYLQAIHSRLIAISGGDPAEPGHPPIGNPRPLAVTWPRTTEIRPRPRR